MLIYLYGPDSYRRQGKLNKTYLENYAKKYPGSAPEYFDMKNEDELVRLKDFVGARSLFAKAKLGVITSADEDPKGFRDLLKSNLKDRETTLIVVADKKLPKEFNFLLDEPVTYFEFEPLEGTKLLSYIKSECVSREWKISDEVIRQVAAAEGDDLWRCMTELERLAYGGKSEGTVAAPDFFPLIMTLKSNAPLPRKINALYFALEKNEPAAVFNVLASQVDPVTKIKFADYDIAIKTGKLDYPEALLDFVLSA